MPYLTAVPLCGPCLRIWRWDDASGSSANKRAEAVYEWIWSNGNRELLCARCCAIWRQNAAEDPSLTPARIRQLEAHT